jgi:hypothetical protein
MRKVQYKRIGFLAFLIVGIIAVSAMTTPLSPKAKVGFALMEDPPLELYEISTGAGAYTEDMGIGPIFNDIWSNLLWVEFKVKNNDPDNDYTAYVNVRVRHLDVDLDNADGDYANITGFVSENDSTTNLPMGIMYNIVGDYADGLSPTGMTLGLAEYSDSIPDCFNGDAHSTAATLLHGGDNYLWVRIWIKIKIDFAETKWSGVDQANWRIRIWVHGNTVFPP